MRAVLYAGRRYAVPCLVLFLAAILSVSSATEDPGTHSHVAAGAIAGTSGTIAPPSISPAGDPVRRNSPASSRPACVHYFWPCYQVGREVLSAFHDAALGHKVEQFFVEYAHALAAIIIAVGAVAIGMAKRIGRRFRRP